MPKGEKLHRMPRLYVDRALKSGDIVNFDSVQSNYLSQVMRMKPDSLCRVFDGKTGEYLCRIQQVDRRSTVGGVLEKIRDLAEEEASLGKNRPQLLFTPLKSKSRMQFLVEKATELGVGSMQPVITKRTEVSKVNTQKLRAYCIEASEQCERLSVPEIHEIQTLDSILETWGEEAGGDAVLMPELFCCIERGDGDVPELAQRLDDSVLAGPNAQLRKTGFLVGPEGGFDDFEQEALQSYPCTVCVRLGPLILRAETAAIAALSTYRMILSSQIRSNK